MVDLDQLVRPWWLPTFISPFVLFMHIIMCGPSSRAMSWAVMWGVGLITATLVVVPTTMPTPGQIVHRLFFFFLVLVHMCVVRRCAPAKVLHVAAPAGSTASHVQPCIRLRTWPSPRAALKSSSCWWLCSYLKDAPGGGKVIYRLEDRELPIDCCTCIPGQARQGKDSPP